MNKCFKKAVALLLFLMMLLSSTSTMAFYGPGELTISLGDITLKAGETAFVNVSLPFEAGGISYTPSSEEAVITLATGRQAITLGEDTLTKVDGIDIFPIDSITVFPITERSGEYVWELTSDIDVALTNVVIHRYNDFTLTDFTDSHGNTNYDFQAPECELTEEELAVSTALIINLDASCIIVNGARRYINYSDPSERPLIVDGSIYLPARTLALALGCYSEVIPSKNYVFIRDDANAREFYFTTGRSYEQLERGTKKDIAYHAIFADGEAYLPVRCLSELLTKTVIYNEGIVVIADEKCANEIIDNHFDYAVSLFEGFTSQSTAGTTYHVSASDGSDANNGTIRSPYKTIGRAAAVATAGDTVVIHEGTYREVLKPLNDGTATRPIVFKSAGDGRVVISATKEVTGFEPYGTDGLIAADVTDIGEGRNQIYYNGTALAEARYPDGPLPEMSERSDPISSLYPVIGADFEVQNRSSSEEKARTAVVKSDTLLDQADNYWQGGTYLSVHGYAYSMSSGKIDSSTKGQLNLVETPHQNEYWYNPSTSTTWNYGFITGHINAINMPGEWVVRDGKLIMLPPEGESYETLTLEMKSEQLVIDLKDRKYVQVHGIETFGGSARMNDSEMCVLSDMDMKYISHYTQSADQREGYLTDPEGTLRQNAKEEPCEPQKGEVGIYISGRDNAVINSRIDHSAAAALYLTGLYTYVDNNIMSNCGYMGSYVSGITVYPDPWMTAEEKKGGHSIYNNTIYNMGRHPFKLQSLETTGSPSYSAFLPVEVAYNDFHDGNLFTLDTGLVYVYHVNASTRKMRSKVHSNYVYYTYPDTHPYSFGIYFDGGSQGFDAYNNMIFTTEKDTIISNSYVYRNTTQSDCTFSNNSKITKAIDKDISELEASQFPRGKPFYAGALNKTVPYLLNYDNMDEGVAYYKATGDNVTYDSSAVPAGDGGIILPAQNKEITFKDIDFTSDVNTINIYFGGDRYGRTSLSSDKESLSRSAGVRLEVVIGDPATSPYKHQFSLSTRAENLYETDFATVYTNGITGTHDVHIRRVGANNNADARIYGILLSDTLKDVPEHNAGHIDAVDYNSVYEQGSGSGTKNYNANTSYVSNTHSGVTLWYKDVKVDETANVLKMSICHKSGSEGTTYTRYAHVYVNSLTDENKIGEYSYTMGYTDGSWYSPVEGYSELVKSLEPGTYDIYVKFTGGYTSNFFSFGFIPEMPQSE